MKRMFGCKTLVIGLLSSMYKESFKIATNAEINQIDDHIELNKKLHSIVIEKGIDI